MKIYVKLYALAVPCWIYVLFQEKVYLKKILWFFHPTKTMATLLCYIFIVFLLLLITVMVFRWIFCHLSGVPNLWDLMPDDLTWSWSQDNRNKVNVMCLNQPEITPAPNLWKDRPAGTWFLVPKTLGTAALVPRWMPQFKTSLCSKQNRGKGRASYYHFFYRRAHASLVTPSRLVLSP